MITIKELIFSCVQQYGAAALFVCLLLEYIGFPVPGESLMLMYGFINPGRNLVLSVIIAACGTFSGSLFAYGIGYRFGEGVVLKIGRPFHITKEKLDKVDVLLKKHKAFYIIAARFIPGVRHIIPYLCGISKIRFWENIIYNVVSSAIWCSFFMFLGGIVGKNWAVFSKNISLVSIIALVFIIAALVVRHFAKVKINK